MNVRKFMLGSILVVFILSILSVATLAKGSYSSTTDDATEEALACNDLGTLQERLECRFSEGSAAQVPEACDGLNVEALCIDFYDRAGYCYDLADGVDKNSCFLQESGYAEEKSEENKRWYITAMLYELQEYVEDEYDGGIIDANEASELIASIIEMKRLVLAGADLDEIAVDFQEYRQERGV